MGKGFSGAFEKTLFSGKPGPKEPVHLLLRDFYRLKEIPVQILFLNFLFCVEFIRDVDIAVVDFWIFVAVIVLRFYFVVQHSNPLSNFDLNGWLQALG